MPLPSSTPTRPSSPDDYLAGIRAGNRVVLSQAITLVESKLPRHQELAQAIIELCMPYSGGAIRVGITGSPGVGKSSFIEALGSSLLEQHRLAVLAIDPSSQISKGSILGDKTRMLRLSTAERAYVRPSPASDSLGGVARKTRETIILVEAAGYDVVFIETVGVGQSEIAVHAMVDFFLLLLPPGGGDELQGIKRGVVEMADLIAVNKADGTNAQAAKVTAAAYRNALHLFPPKPSQWTPPVLTCSANQGLGLQEVWHHVLAQRQLVIANGYLPTLRRQQAQYWLHETIQESLRRQFYQHPLVQAQLQRLEQAVLQQTLSPFHAAQELLALARRDQNQP